MSSVPPDPATLRPLPSTPALSGVLETLAFFRDPDFARSRFERYGDVVETSLLGQLFDDNYVGGSRQLDRRVSERDNRAPITVWSPSDARPSVVADQGAVHGQTGQWHQPAGGC